MTIGSTSCPSRPALPSAIPPQPDQNPYPGARALVTIERYGVLKQWVQTLQDSKPIIEFRVRGLLPGFFLSVLVTSLALRRRCRTRRGRSWQTGLQDRLRAGPSPIRTSRSRLKQSRTRDLQTWQTCTCAFALRPRHRNGPTIEAAVVVLDEAVWIWFRRLRVFRSDTGFYDLDGLMSEITAC